MKINEDTLMLFSFLVISFNNHQLFILKLSWLPDWEKRKLNNNSYSQIKTRFEPCGMKDQDFQLKVCSIGAWGCTIDSFQNQLWGTEVWYHFFFCQNLYINLKELVMNR